MNERVKKVFEILGVEPNEAFKIEGKEGIYCIYKSLEIEEFDSRVFDFVTMCSSNAMLTGLLNGSYKIKKLINLTEEERVICNTATRAGYPWIARDSNGELNLFKEKPNRSIGNEEFVSTTGCKWISLFHPLFLFLNIFEFITWKSDPINVNDLLNGELYV